MCDLVTAGLALTGVSTAMSTLAQFRASQAQKVQAEAQAQLSERAAADRIERGRDEEGQLRLQARQAMGRQKVALAANGMDLSGGSPLDILMDTASAAERDAFTIRQSAEIDAMNLKTQGAMSRAAADNISPATAAATTFIGGASQFADRWTRYRPGTKAANTMAGKSSSPSYFIGGT